MLKDSLEFKMAEFVERRNADCRSLGLSAKYSYYFAEKTNTAYIRIVDSMIPCTDLSYIFQNVDGDFGVFYDAFRGQSSFLIQFTFDV